MTERVGLILSLVRALSGEITANMRAVLIRKDQSEIKLRFIFYDNLSEADEEAANAIGGEVLADFDGHETLSERHEINARGRIVVSDQEEVVYRRKD